MVERGSGPNGSTFSMVLDALCRSERTKEAYRLFLVLRTRDFQVHHAVYSSLMAGLFHDGETTKALEVWDEMVKKKHKLDRIAYNVVIDGLCKASRFHEACMYYIASIEANEACSMELYNEVVDGLRKDGRTDDVINLLKSLVKRNMCG
jgi:pentatricopeptide repeat protein